MTITVHITKNSSKIFSAKIDSAMMNNRKQREGIRKPPPDYVGGKLLTRLQRAIYDGSRGVDGRSEIFRWSRLQRNLAAAQVLQYGRESAADAGETRPDRGERGAEKFGGRRWMFVLQI